MELIDFFKKEFERNYNMMSLEAFLKLPRRAQELLWTAACDHRTSFLFQMAYPVSHEEINKSSPIEIIFDIALRMYANFKAESVPVNEIGNPEIGSPPAIMIRNIINDYEIRQQEIIVNGKKYIADFLFDGENSDFCDWIGGLKIVIECDGHNFHQKTKKQVAYDNERQLALQTAGYDVIRFSGSQIYKDPIGCAENAYNFILSKIKR